LEETIVSEVALLSFGCAVSFIVVAAVYIYASEDFTRVEVYRKQKVKSADREVKDLSKVA
jgi:hypothetical protein